MDDGDHDRMGVNSKRFCFLGKGWRRGLVPPCPRCWVDPSFCPRGCQLWVEGPSSQWVDIDFRTVVSPGYFFFFSTTCNQKGGFVKIGARHLERQSILQSLSMHGGSPGISDASVSLFWAWPCGKRRHIACRQPVRSKFVSSLIWLRTTVTSSPNYYSLSKCPRPFLFPSLLPMRIILKQFLAFTPVF